MLCRHETVDRLLRSYGHLHIGAVAVYFYSSLMFVMCLYIYLKTTWKSHNRVKVIFEFFTLHLIIVMEVIWAHFSFYELYRGIVLTNFGLVESLIICKMIIASVTKVRMLRCRCILSIFIVR